MARQVTPAFKRSLAQLSGTHMPLWLLEINQSFLLAPVRYANGGEDFVLAGANYVACPFSITLPDDVPNQLPRAELSVGSTSRDLARLLEQTRGGQYATATLRLVSLAAPTVVEYEIVLQVQSTSLTPTTFTAQLGFEDVLNRPGLGVRYDTLTAPGLF
jgi:hypothetical protein